MAGFLLDTHTAIWFFNGDNSLSKTANNIIRDILNPIYISIASVWELSIKIGIGKLTFNGRAAGFIRLAESNNIAILPIKSTHLTILESLPFIHRDPFDRLLVATALAEEMTIITIDENIIQYEVSKIW